MTANQPIFAATGFHMPARHGMAWIDGCIRGTSILQAGAIAETVVQMLELIGTTDQPALTQV